MKVFIYSLVLLISVVLQITLARWIAIFDISPDFTILALGFTALVFSRNVTTLLAFAAGLLRDSTGVSSPGISALVFTIVGFAAGTFMFRRSFQKRYEVLLVFSVLIITYLLLYQFFLHGLDHNFWMLMLTDLLPRYVYSIALLLGLLIVLPNSVWNVQK